MNLENFKRAFKPVDILNDLKTADPEFWKYELEDKAETIIISAPTPLMDLKTPEAAAHQELIKDRYLCKGGAILLAGPTGVGKSSFSMQLAISFSLGMSCFGLTPPRALRVLLLQAENDDGDLVEMRDGVILGMGVDKTKIRDKLMVVTDDSSTREKFAAVLGAALEGGQYDLVIVDPALAYMGCSASDQGPVSAFLRNMLNPVLHKHNVGMILVHHTNKPKSGEEKAEWKGSDLSYIGAGSAEFANWARAVLAIRTTHKEQYFELVAAKRGRRLGWKDARGQFTSIKHIAHHKGPGVICWREVEEEEVNAGDIRAEATPEKVRRMVASGSVKLRTLVNKLVEDTGVRTEKAKDIVTQATTLGMIRTVNTGGDTSFRAAGAEKAPDAGPGTPEEKREPIPF